MGNMIIDLQLASENTEGLPSERKFCNGQLLLFTRKVIMSK